VVGSLAVAPRRLWLPLASALEATSFQPFHLIRSRIHRLIPQARAQAAAAAVGALAAAPRGLWLPLAAALVPLIEATPPALPLADTQALLLRLQVPPRSSLLTFPLLLSIFRLCSTQGGWNYC